MNTTIEPAPAVHEGMGAIPLASGVAFRVWAPHAEKVFVTGTFNHWASTAHPLASEENGFWSAEVPEAKPGDEYKYRIINGDLQLLKNDPYSRELTSSTGNSIVYDPSFDWNDDDYRFPAWNELVIYEMHVGTFNKQGEGPGTFYTAIEKLAYLKDLGVNVIEVMPTMEFPGDFSWGYNPAYPFAVESKYGGPNGLKTLIKAAHKQGIGVILDVVYNHFGPGDLDLWQFDGWSENEQGGIYFYNDWRAQTPWGNTRPDYGRGEVRQYIRDNALMWLQEFRADGLRWDATAFIRNVYGNENDLQNDLPEGWGLMQWIHEEIKEQEPWKITIAEDLRDNEAITRDVSEGGAGFSAQWDGGFVHPVRHVIIPPDDEARQMHAIRDAILRRFGGDAIHRVIFTESHDEVANGKARVPEEIWPGKVGNWFSKKRSSLGVAFVLTSPGIPMLFQGQEFLEDRWFQDRDPLEWSRVEKYSGLVYMYRDLIELRRNLNGNTGGLCGPHVNVHHVQEELKVIAYHRWDQAGPKNSVIVVANLANRAYDTYHIGFPRQGIWKLRFNSDWSGYDPSYGDYPSTDIEARQGEKDGMDYTGEIKIGPYSVLIYSQDT